jgi:spore coat protein A, manganese oxidase
LLFIITTISTTIAQPLLDPASQPKFVNQLPVPPVINGLNGGTYTITVSQFRQWLGLVNPTNGQPITTPVWGYNGSYPGPTIVASKNVQLDISWINGLVDGNNHVLPHLLPVDPTIHWAFMDLSEMQQYGVPIVTHLHGGHTATESDGLPDAWYTPGFTRKGERFIIGDQEPYHYPNTQEAATIWYHDHALGITRLNVYAGLAGFYLITDENETALRQSSSLPAASYDLGLAIQDRMFKANGELFYPSAPEAEGEPETSILPEMFGDFILVNGMTWPVLNVEPRQYRFRILNGSDSRFYNFYLSNGQSFIQIGSDDGLLYAPVTLSRMLIGPGERRDVIIDFSNPALRNQTIILKNNAKTPYPTGEAVDEKTTGQIMAFRVNVPLNTSAPLTHVGTTLRSSVIEPLQSTHTRKLILFEAKDDFGRLMPMLGTAENGVADWDDGITENPALGSTETWEIYNETMDAHPVHLHAVKMQLVNRQKFMAEVNETTGAQVSSRLIGQPQLPAAEESGWKDTWIAYPKEVTRVIATFDLPGRYVWHCHILSHEDHEMMRQYYVGTMPAQMTMRKTPVQADVPETIINALVTPNPSTGIFVLQLNLKQRGSMTLNIYDVKGKLVEHRNVEGSAGIQQVQINGSNWAAGLYYCEVVVGKERLTTKLVKEN